MQIAYFPTHDLIQSAQFGWTNEHNAAIIFQIDFIRLICKTQYDQFASSILVARYQVSHLCLHCGQYER